MTRIRWFNRIVMATVAMVGLIALATALWGAEEPARRMSVDLGEGVRLDLVWIAPGRYVRGSPAREAGRREDETAHGVVLSRGFWMSVCEVTQAQWTRVMGANPSFFEGSNRPVESVSWEEVQRFLEIISERAGGCFRLPTEAEWEYACRAGTTSETAGDLAAMAWYAATSEGSTRPVGEKQPNAWGLHDMHGNVAEWCQDWYGPYPRGTVHDPPGPASGLRRVVRGGSWLSEPRHCRSAARQAELPDTRSSTIGFRVVREADGP